MHTAMADKGERMRNANGCAMRTDVQCERMRNANGCVMRTDASRERVCRAKPATRASVRGRGHLRVLALAGLGILPTDREPYLCLRAPGGVHCREPCDVAAREVAGSRAGCCCTNREFDAACSPRAHRTCAVWTPPLPVGGNRRRANMSVTGCISSRGAARSRHPIGGACACCVPPVLSSAARVASRSAAAPPHAPTVGTGERWGAGGSGAPCGSRLRRGRNRRRR